jgi:hypothetical protein
MGKAVAGDGDVTATPGTKMFKPADSGTWSAGTVVTTPYPKLQAGPSDAHVIWKATCLFAFSGFKGQVAVAGTETVTLTAAGTAKLQKGKNGVLLDGDEAEGEGSYGNKLKASSSRKLRS